MSDRPIPTTGPDQNCGFYWGWLSREGPESDYYRWITTTSGLADSSFMVDDSAMAVREFIAARVHHLRNVISGWEHTLSGLNAENAQPILSEILTGCRTLLDFETRNFSMKNKPNRREQFPPHYSGNPILLKETTSTLEQKGSLPATPIIFAQFDQRFYTPQTTDLYYDLLMGDSKVFHNILQSHNKTPNMPPPQISPLPYHAAGPTLQRNHNTQQLAYRMNPPLPMAYGPQPVMISPLGYTLMPPFMQVPIQRPIPDAYAGPNYIMQPPNERRHGPYEHREQVNGNRVQNVDEDQQPGRVQENENVTTSSSSSSSTVNNAVAGEEEGPCTESNQSENDEAKPSTSDQAEEKTNDENVVVDASVSSNSSSETETTEVVLTTVRKFSEVVSSKVKKTAPTAFTAFTEKAETSEQENVNEIKQSEMEQAKEMAAGTVTDALVVDTSEQAVASAPPTSRRTLAEIVQQSLSAAPSPATVSNGTSQATPSPALKQKGPSQKESSCSSAASVLPEIPIASGIKRQSISYAEMLHASPRGSLHAASQNSQTSRSSTSSASSSSPKDVPEPSEELKEDPFTEPEVEAKIESTTANPKEPHQAGIEMKEPKHVEEWQTVNPKKAAEPTVLEPVYVAKTVRNVTPKTTAAPKPSESEDEEKSDDQDAEKKRQKRREKRQKLKEANRQQKQNEKEIARQESLARVDAMNGNAPRQPTPPPVFDRTNLAARRRKRQELQNKTQRSGSGERNNASASPPKIPIIPILKGQSIGSSTPAGQAAMAAYGLPHLPNQFRHSSSPFAIIAPDSNGTIPLFLPDRNQTPLRVASFDESSPVPLSKQLGLDDLLQKKEVDENAAIIEKLLMFHSLELVEMINCPEHERTTIAKGIEDIKRMYVRVEKAGKLSAYKKGSSKVTPKTEEKIVALVLKLLSNKGELSQSDDLAVSEITNKISELSPSFTYTNFLSALLDFSQERADALPDGTNLRKSYEQTVVLTKVFLKRTKNLYERIGKMHDFSAMEYV